MPKSKAYTFKTKNDTHEIHIHEGDFTDSPTRCNSNEKSICKESDKATSTNNIPFGICLNEDEARKRAAEIGRGVCGTCVSHLYTTYE